MSSTTPWPASPTPTASHTVADPSR
jgi:hypothetical protein